MLLKEGDKIRAVGFPLLAGLNDGKVWKVEKILEQKLGIFDEPFKIYKFVRRGKIVCFEAYKVDSWLDPEFVQKNINYFEIVK